MDKGLVTKGIQMVHDGNYWEAIEILLEELPNDNSEGKIASFIALSYYYLMGKGSQDSRSMILCLSREYRQVIAVSGMGEIG